MPYRLRYKDGFIFHISGHHFRYNTYDDALEAIERVTEECRLDFNGKEISKEDFVIEDWNKEESQESWQRFRYRELIAYATYYSQTHVN